ncbi:MAG TPA: TetR family transcriptional regulator, partial [Egicoccus sp.]
MSSPAPADTRTRILDAALELIGRRGVARTSLEDVAAGAGVSRQTVYRHAGSRDGLLTLLVLREEERLLARLREVVEGQHELRAALEAAIGVALRFAQDHPLFGRLAQTEPAALLPILLDGQGPVLTAAREVVVDLLLRWTPHLDQPQRELVAEACTRLIVSYAISPAAGDLDELSSGLARLIGGGVGWPTNA